MINTSDRVCTLREAQYEDGETATQLLRELGLILPVGQDEMRYHWRRLWVDNPALNVDRPNLAKGWLLEDNGRMVGFFGNIPLLYDYCGRPIIIADASQWGVEKEYRDQTPRLAEAYFRQENADLLLVTTGIKQTGRLFERYGGRPVPQPSYDQVLYWILNTREFLKAGLKKKGVATEFASVAALASAPVAGVAMTLKGNRSFGQSRDIDIIEISDIGDEFDELWLRKRDEADRLLACRTADCLRWHFGTNSMSARTRFLISRNTNELAGYATIMREDAPEIGLKRLKIIDLFVAGDDEVVVNDLLAAAYEIGITDGCYVLELVGLPEPLRRKIVSRYRPRLRQMPTWPIYFKNLLSDLDLPLQDENTWYVTSYDGDTAIF